jgi:hypothetical protein
MKEMTALELAQANGFKTEAFGDGLAYVKTFKIDQEGEDIEFQLHIARESSAVSGAPGLDDACSLTAIEVERAELLRFADTETLEQAIEIANAWLDEALVAGGVNADLPGFITSAMIKAVSDEMGDRPPSATLQ